MSFDPATKGPSCTWDVSIMPTGTVISMAVVIRLYK